MASNETKEVGHVEPSSQEIMAKLKEMINEAKNSGLSEEILNKSRAMIAHQHKDENVNEIVGGTKTPVIVLGGNLASQTLRPYATLSPLTLFDSKLWFGDIVTDYPNSVVNDGSVGFFAQLCVTDDGIMAAVVYTGNNIDGVECGWLLAWSDSNDEKKKRVYAECGRKSKFDCIDWGRIEENLKKAVNATIVNDPETGTWVHANIIGLDYPVETQDTLSAIFTG